MTYSETLDYLFNQLPMYQRIGGAAYKVDLSNTISLCAILNNPHKKFKTIHIAGTNGKGSTSHMLASIFQQAGYKVGLYTSPHLKDFRERIKINGEMIPEEEVINFVESYKLDFEKINLSFFEWTVGLAFYYFANQRIDVAIIETGLGGRLDSTNVITPELSVITNIGIDHTQFLGDTLEKIATEKAGIIKQKTPVVIGETHPETKQVFNNIALNNNSSIYFADTTINDELPITDLKGSYQRKNIKTVLQSCKILQNKGWKINEDNIKRGLLSVVKNTGLLGRWQKLSDTPLIICDVGHNESGIQEIINQISKTDYKKLHFVFGAVNDKSIDNILMMLSKSAEYYLCQANIPRAMDIDELYTKFYSLGFKATKHKSVKDAFNNAKKSAEANDLIFIGGSTFVVAEIL